MDITSKREVSVVISLTEREAKLLTCLFGAMSPSDAEDTIRRGVHFDEWIDSLDRREVIDFTGELYDKLYDLF